MCRGKLHFWFPPLIAFLGEFLVVFGGKDSVANAPKVEVLGEEPRSDDERAMPSLFLDERDMPLVEIARIADSWQ